MEKTVLALAEDNLRYARYYASDHPWLVAFLEGLVTALRDEGIRTD